MARLSSAAAKPVRSEADGRRRDATLLALQAACRTLRQGVLREPRRRCRSPRGETSALISVSILAAGMVTAVGFNYAASCAAIRAGIKGIRVLNLWDAENGEYLSGAKVDLPQWWEG